MSIYEEPIDGVPEVACVGALLLLLLGVLQGALLLDI